LIEHKSLLFTETNTYGKVEFVGGAGQNEGRANAAVGHVRRKESIRSIGAGNGKSKFW